MLSLPRLWSQIRPGVDPEAHEGLPLQIFLRLSLFSFPFHFVHLHLASLRWLSLANFSVLLQPIFITPFFVFDPFVFESRKALFKRECFFSQQRFDAPFGFVSLNSRSIVTFTPKPRVCVCRFVGPTPLVLIPLSLRGPRILVFPRFI